jgi:hypothetical protein
MTIPGTTDPTASSAPDGLPAQYDPAGTESAIYERWLQAGCFTADAERSNRLGTSLPSSTWGTD